MRSINSEVLTFGLVSRDVLPSSAVVLLSLGVNAEPRFVPSPYRHDSARTAFTISTLIEAAFFRNDMVNPFGDVRVIAPR